jgi:hypothetical protein
MIHVSKNTSSGRKRPTGLRPGNGAVLNLDSYRGHAFTGCGKTLVFDFVLKGRGFKPRRKCHKINLALAAEVALSLQKPLFPQPVQACRQQRI